MPLRDDALKGTDDAEEPAAHHSPNRGSRAHRIGAEHASTFRGCTGAHGAACRTGLQYPAQRVRRSVRLSLS